MAIPTIEGKTSIDVIFINLVKVFFKFSLSFCKEDIKGKVALFKTLDKVPDVNSGNCCARE